MRRARSIISVITSVCVAWATVAPSRALADPPTTGLNPTTIAASAALGLSPVLANTMASGEVPAVDGGSLEAVASWQKRFQDFYNFPELFMTIAAASMTVLALAELWKFVKEDAPAYWAARKALKKTDAAYVIALTFEKDFPQLVESYAKATQSYHAKAAALEKRRRNLMVTLDLTKVGIEPAFKASVLRLRREIGHLSPGEQTRKISNDQNIRRLLRQSEGGLAWLERWDQTYQDYRQTKAEVFKTFRPIKQIVHKYSQALEEAATGIIRNPELRIAPLRVNLNSPKNNESSEIETLIHTNNFGGSEEIHDARKLPRKLGMTKRDCEGILSRLSNVRESHRNRMTVAKWKFGIFSAGAVTAGGGYMLGNVQFKNRHHADPLQIVQEKKKEQAVQEARLAAEATSPVSMSDTLKTWQKEEVPSRIMSAVRSSFKAHVIPKLADDIRRIGRGKLDTEMEARLKEIESTPEVLDTIVRNSLADAIAEYKIADLTRLEKALLADASDPMQSDAKELREQVIAFAVAASPKHIWPNLVARPNMYPVDVTTTIPKLVDSVREALEDLRKTLLTEALARENKAKAQNGQPAANKSADSASAPPQTPDPTKTLVLPPAATTNTTSMVPVADPGTSSLAVAPAIPTLPGVLSGTLPGQMAQ